MKKLTVAVVGALGAVGTEMLRTLEKSSLPLQEIVPLDIAAHQGKTVSFRNQLLTVKTAEPGAFRSIDIALFSAGEQASLALAQVAVAEGAVVIDNSNAWRMDPAVPLVVPEVNPQAAGEHRGIIANPNCSTIQMLVALKPLHDRFKIKRIVVATYQAVSGTGLPAIRELSSQAKDCLAGKTVTPAVYPHQIAFNCLPHIDTFLKNGYTKEEMKMFHETRKILGDPNILVTATAVRVPVFRCHSEALNIETENALPSVEAVRELLREAPGVEVVDDVGNNLYPLASLSAGADKVAVGRIRQDFSVPNGLNLWVVGDNLRKGAALNAVQIAELLVEKNWLKRE
ncbi:MAG: aspartate-semialdehyde dehydrogenase [Clostridia bacterium]|jgi:aspartate-semialdehyde dehydrogenase|nr:aspartate-semialdehyde dehydrogenase [Clostridia bacterium]